MSTTSHTVDREILNAFLTAWYEDAGNLAGIASRLGMTLLDLAEFAMHPEVVAAVEVIDAVARRRADSLALALRTDAIMRLDTIVHSTKTDTPRDREAVRKAANDIVKASHLPHDAAYNRFSNVRRRVEESRKALIAPNPAASLTPDQRMPTPDPRLPRAA